MQCKTILQWNLLLFKVYFHPFVGKGEGATKVIQLFSLPYLHLDKLQN